MKPIFILLVLAVAVTIGTATAETAINSSQIIEVDDLSTVKVLNLFLSSKF